MKIGMTIPLDYLSRSGDSDDVQFFQNVFGPPAACLATLRDHGVAAIELKFNAATPPAALAAALRLIAGRQLMVSLHGYLPAATVACSFAAMYPALATAGPALNALADEVVLVVHPAKSDPADAAAFVAITATRLAAVSDAIRQQGLPLKLALENIRFRGADSPEITWDGILAMATDRAGLCWDMGHSHFTAMQGRIPAAAPPAFTKRVIHTHVHGMSPEGATHWPLLPPYREHVEAGMNQLKMAGFRGIYNLELLPFRWPAALKTAGSVLESIDWLRQGED